METGKIKPQSIFGVAIIGAIGFFAWKSGLFENGTPLTTGNGGYGGLNSDSLGGDGSGSNNPEIVYKTDTSQNTSNEIIDLTNLAKTTTDARIFQNTKKELARINNLQSEKNVYGFTNQGGITISDNQGKPIGYVDVVNKQSVLGFKNSNNMQSSNSPVRNDPFSVALRNSKKSQNMPVSETKSENKKMIIESKKSKITFKKRSE